MSAKDLLKDKDKKFRLLFEDHPQPMWVTDPESGNFLEANGAGKENHDQNANGDKYYFTDGKLIAATAADGKSIDVKSAEAKKMSEKLQKESEAFRAAVK